MKLIDSKCVDTLRVLGADIITKAKSGHPGIVLGAAPIAHTLFTKHLNIKQLCKNRNNRTDNSRLNSRPKWLVAHILTWPSSLTARLKWY